MHHADGFTTILQSALDALTTPERLTVSQWADQHRILPTSGSSEPGQWRTRRTPYLQEIMDCLSAQHPARRIIFMKSAQTGATEALLNAVGHFIASERAPLLIVQPSHEMAERFSKQRLAPMIGDSPQLAALINPARQRDSGNTIFSKEWPGGICILAGANSPASLRSMPAKFVFCDEVDGYPGDLAGEGDPVSLAEARSTAFPGRKLLMISTPTVNSLSRIQKEYEASDQRRYWVACPECSEYQILEWEHLTWPPGKPEQAAYACVHCGSLISERHKAGMLRKGQWRAQYPERSIIGFHLNALYSAPGLGLNWRELAAQWEAAQDDPDRQRAFINLRLGLATADPDEQLDEAELQHRAEDYLVRQLPEGALFITAGVDVQKDRLAIVTLGHGRNGHVWVLDWVELRGDPTKLQLWIDLDQYIEQPFESNQRSLKISALAIDTGYLPDDCFNFIRQRKGRAIACKGSSFRGKPIIASKPSKVDFTPHGRLSKQGAELWFIGGDSGKQWLFTRLAKDREANAEDRLIHFPKNLDSSFYSQLTAEVYDKRHNRWSKIRPRNEALDCTIYAIAAAFQPKWRIHLWTETQWAKVESQTAKVESQTIKAAPDLSKETAPDSIPETAPKPPAAHITLAPPKSAIPQKARPVRFQMHREWAL